MLVKWEDSKGAKNEYEYKICGTLADLVKAEL